MNIKVELLSDPLLYTQYVFDQVHRKTFHVAEHHRVIADTLKKVLTGELTRVIFNVPPRYGKSELVVKMFMTMGLCFNPASKFIHTSYSERLALDNSETVRDYLRSEAIQPIFNVKSKPDSDAKSKWYTPEGGGVYATSSGGQITGFGAGDFDAKIFSGAIIIDDPQKPIDALSLIKRTAVNDHFDNTIRSRVNSEKTPIIVIMQRLHKDDLTGYLLKNEPDQWHHVNLQAIKEDGTALWPEKHSVEHLNRLCRVNSYVYYSQYQQEPEKAHKTGNEFLKEFKPSKHIGTAKYNDQYEIHIVADNNVRPYISLSLWQKMGNDIRQFHEIACKDPDNTATKAGQRVADYLDSINFKSMVFIRGDASAKAENTIDDDKKSFFDKLVESIQRRGHQVRREIGSSNPSVAISGQFVNAVLAGAYPYNVLIDDSCVISKEDYEIVKEDENGSMLKKKETDPASGAKYEPHGHYTDNLRYFLTGILRSEYESYLDNGEVFQASFSDGSKHR